MKQRSLRKIIVWNQFYYSRRMTKKKQVEQYTTAFFPCEVVVPDTHPSPLVECNMSDTEGNPPSKSSIDELMEESINLMGSVLKLNKQRRLHGEEVVKVLDDQAEKLKQVIDTLAEEVRGQNGVGL